ncbi:GntR family transcriptional regulator [Lapidilactobacillus achengensis]|uniref:GntR family transcriptional regulator n=1 Tax=Lapidilactobacillus achengensis TaxID=2486000 RepID=A0ABW1UTV6_9LACO|nr:GntR family transcriptional regulator [Lapidilactobacillus achengensis]
MQQSPKYELIANELRKRITTGKYQPNELIPDQVALAEEFGVSRMTIKKAIDGLAMEGLLYTRRGDGTYVMGDISLKIEQNSPAEEHLGLTASFEEGRVTSKIIQFDIRFPSESLQKHLKLEKNEPIFEILRLRLLDGRPYVLEHTYMPQKLMPGLDEAVLMNSIYAYLKNTVNLKLSGAYRRIHALFADELDVKYLECKEGDPVLEVEQVSWLDDGTPFEYSFSRNKYDARSYNVLDIG